MKKFALVLTSCIISICSFTKSSFGKVGCRVGGDFIYSTVKSTVPLVYYDSDVKKIDYGSIGCGPINVSNFSPYTSCTNESNIPGGYLVNYDEPTPCPIDTNLLPIVLLSSFVFSFILRKQIIDKKLTRLFTE